MNIKGTNNANNPNNHAESTTNSPINELRQQIIDAIPSLNSPENGDAWWLLGTTGCHLCGVAEDVLSQFQAVQPITYRHIDISDFDEALMMRFATTIPVIMTQTQRLDYPFSVLDLQHLLAK